MHHAGGGAGFVVTDGSGGLVSPFALNTWTRILSVARAFAAAVTGVNDPCARPCWYLVGCAGGVCGVCGVCGEGSACGEGSVGGVGGVRGGDEFPVCACMGISGVCV